MNAPTKVVEPFTQSYKGMTLHFGEALIWLDHAEVDVVEGDIKAYGFVADRIPGSRKIRVIANRHRETDTERAGKVKECAGAFLRDHMNRLAKKPELLSPPRQPAQLTIEGLG